MKKSGSFVACVFLFSVALAGQEGSAPGDCRAQAQDVIQKVACAETQNKAEKYHYTFRQDYEVLELGAGDKIKGHFNRVSDVHFDDQHKMREQIISYPTSTLQELRVTYEDIRDQIGVQPFALTQEDLAHYQVEYLGDERISTREAFVFEVKPKQIQKGERYFQGKIWVDKREFHIVKSAGQAVPELDDQRFPHFETIYSKFGGRYWFPIHTSADDILKFKRGPRVHIRMTIRYYDYKRYTVIPCIEGINCPEPRAQFNRGPAEAPEPGELLLAQTLNEEILKLKSEGKYKEAIPIAERVLAIFEQAYQRNTSFDHIYISNCFDGLAELYRAAEDYVRAEDLYSRALEVRKKVLGPDHPDLVRPLSILIDFLYSRNEYEKAGPYLELYLSIAQKSNTQNRETGYGLSMRGLLPGKADFSEAEHQFQQAIKIKEEARIQDANFALLLNQFAQFYLFSGDPQKAEPLLQRARTICISALPKQCKVFPYILNNLAQIAYSKGDYATADGLAQEALSNIIESRGAQDFEVAVFKSNTGMIHYMKGDYEKAEPLLQGAVALCGDSPRKESFQCAMFHNNLAALLYAEGKYAKSKSEFLQARHIFEKDLGGDAPGLSANLNNLGLLAYNDGDYLEAERLMQQALQVEENVLGPDHPDLATFLNNLGQVYQVKGDFENAEKYLQRSIHILETSFTKNSVFLIEPLNNLASVYRERRNLPAAEERLKRALAIGETELGLWNPRIAALLNNLGLFYQEEGKLADAERLLLRSLDIVQLKFGKEHPHAASTLNTLALVYADQKQYEKAEASLKKSLAILEKATGPNNPEISVVLRNLSSLDELLKNIPKAIELRERANKITEYILAHNLLGGTERQKLLYLSTLADDIDYTVSLHLRSAPGNAAAAELALTTVLGRKGRVLDAMMDDLMVLRQRDPRNRELLDKLADARSRLLKIVMGGDQREITRQQNDVERLENAIGLRGAERNAAGGPLTLASLRETIPRDAALIEFISYEPFNGQTLKWEVRHYAAYVLHNSGAIQWVDLGEAAAINQHAAALLEALRTPESTNFMQLARTLDEELMRPVRKLLGNVHMLLTSPDRSLNLVPFATLVDENNHYLLENYSISYLTSGRDLMRLKTTAPERQKAVVIGNPEFDWEPKVLNPVPEPAQDQLPDQPAPGNRRSLEFLLQFAPLGKAPHHLEELGNLLKAALVLEGTQATEGAVKNVSGPEVLHLETHGFFLASETVKPPDEPGRILSPTAAALKENPLLRSGVALAGANHLNGGNGEDGILTALEVAGLDLWGTRLVVLSACETARGDLRAGEGIYGLRRALVLAGSESQIISLWKLDPLVTQAFFTAYYRLVAEGKGRGEALRLVQLDMLKNVSIRHPYYWAPMIQSGNWRSLVRTPAERK